MLMFPAKQLDSMTATTITIDGAVRDRLKGFSVGSYNDTLTALMDRIEREEFIKEFRRMIDDPATDWETIDWDDPVWD